MPNWTYTPDREGLNSAVSAGSGTNPAAGDRACKGRHVKP